MVEVPHFCSLRPEAGQLSFQASPSTNPRGLDKPDPDSELSRALYVGYRFPRLMCRMRGGGAVPSPVLTGLSDLRGCTCQEKETGVSSFLDRLHGSSRSVGHPD